MSRYEELRKKWSEQYRRSSIEGLWFLVAELIDYIEYVRGQIPEAE